MALLTRELHRSSRAPLLNDEDQVASGFRHRQQAPLCRASVDPCGRAWPRCGGERHSPTRHCRVPEPRRANGRASGAMALAQSLVPRAGRGLAFLDLRWQKAVGYGRRSLAETAISRYKTVIGHGLRARTLPAQNTEARVGCSVLNRMTRLGMPVSQRIA